MIGWGGLIAGKESQDLYAAWRWNVTSNEGRAEGLLENSATYSTLVHGSGEDGEEMQTVFHGAHGWPIAKHVVQSVSGDMSAATTVKGRVINIGERIGNSLKRLFG